MKNLALNTLAVLALTFGLVAVGHAAPVNVGPTPFSAPEIDPAMGAAALALVSGAVMVIRGRRKA